MKLSAEKIDEIVRNVLRELQTRAAVPPTTPVQPPAAKPTAASTGRSDDVVVIRGRVVTEDVLAESRVAGKTVSLMRGAILTPSGRDYIRKNAVRLSSILPEPEVSVRGIVLIAGKSQTAQAAAQAASWKVSQVEDSLAAAVAARDAVASVRVLCVTEDPSIVACLLNREATIRSAVLGRSEGFEKLIRRMHPNVVCLSSDGWSFSELTRLLRLMSSFSGPPDSWKELIPGGIR